MATKIVTKNSSTASAVPTASDLVQGELAVNVADKRLFTEDNGGSIVELGTNPSTLTVTGEITANGGIALGDSDKATFGAGSDLQIYHDGSNSYISEGGDGELLLRTNGAGIRLQKNNGENMLKALTDGAVQLYYDNQDKLATTSTGIDVTGTATMDGLTVDGVARVDGNITIGRTTGSYLFTEVDGGSERAGIHSSADNDLTFKVNNQITAINIDGTTRDISFYEDTGTTPKLFWDASAESLGIGTSSPSEKLQVDGNIRIGDTATGTNDDEEYSITSGGQLLISANDSAADVSYSGLILNAGKAGGAAASSSLVTIKTNDAERMRIDSSGNVGIGISPAAKFDVLLGSTSRLLLRERSSRAYIDSVTETNGAFDSLGINGSEILFEIDGTEKARIDSSGNVGIGTTANYSNRLYIQSDATGSLPTNQLIQQNDSNVITVKNGNNSATYSGIKLETRTTGASGWLIANEWKSTYLGDLVFKARDAGTSSAERMRIDSSGNLLIGKTTTGVAGAGIVLRGGGELFVTRAGDVMNLNRLSTDGEILAFRRDGVSVGSVSASNSFYVGQGDTGLGFFATDNIVFPAHVANVSARDNAIDLGYTNGRFDDIYATNGTIQTSDRNEKQDIEELSDAEQRVAVAAKGLLRKFCWKDSVAEKGDEARVHFGIIAQDLQAAFAAEGLDAGDYAMFISTTWTDEETNEEKTRMGVRYSELLAFIIAAL